MHGLTARQVEVLRFVAEHTAKNGMPPSMREMGRQLGIRSTNGVNDHLRALERKGMIMRRDMLSRSVVLTNAGAMQLGLAPEGPADNAVKDLREAVLLAVKALRSLGEDANARAILDVAGLEG